MLCLTRAEFEAFAREYPEVLWKLLQALCERVRRINEDVLDLSFRDVPYRVLRLLAQHVSHHGESGPTDWRIRTPRSPHDASGIVASSTETDGRRHDPHERDRLHR